MTDKSLEMLKWLLEDLETDEGVCYKTRSSTCDEACRVAVRIMRKYLEEQK